MAIDFDGSGNALMLEVELCPDAATVSLAGATISWTFYVATDSSTDTAPSWTSWLNGSVYDWSSVTVATNSVETFSYTMPSTRTSSDWKIGIFLQGIPTDVTGTVYVDNFSVSFP